MSHRPAYVLAAGLFLAVLAIAMASVSVLSGVPDAPWNASSYIWIGGMIVLAVVMGLFIGLALRSRR